MVGPEYHLGGGFLIKTKLGEPQWLHYLLRMNTRPSTGSSGEGRGMAEGEGV